MSNLRLVERDYLVFQEVNRWYVILSRHLKDIANFSSQRTCDRRLKKLIEAGFLDRKKYIYGVPYLYFLTRKAKVLIGASTRVEKIRLEQISHDITTLNVAIYLNKVKGIPFQDMLTEKQLHSSDGFSNRKHRPDFIYQINGKTTCVEVELSLKSKDRLEKNIKENFTNYDSQVWIVSDRDCKIATVLNEQSKIYPNIEILDLKEVNNHE